MEITSKEIMSQTNILLANAQKNLRGESRNSFVNEVVNKKWVAVESVEGLVETIIDEYERNIFELRDRHPYEVKISDEDLCSIRNELKHMAMKNLEADKDGNTR